MSDDKLTVGFVSPAPGEYTSAGQTVAFELRVENPEHDSLFQRFEQLEELIEASKGDYTRANDALKLAKLIRGQVLK